MNQWILTYTGTKFFPCLPRIGDICIEDIAHALSNICRFTGHTKDFYSVAQHSVHVSAYIAVNGGDRRQQLAGLLHDASEAYLCDIARPIKYLPSLFDYRVAEKRLQSLIYDCFNVVPAEALIKKADDYMLSAEAYFLMPNSVEWEATIKPPDDDIGGLPCWLPGTAKHIFLENFDRLIKNNE